MKLNVLAFSLPAMLLGTTAAFAHHSFAMFDAEKDMMIEGTVKEFSWTNPHVWIDLTVKNAQGVEENWGLESQSVGILFRQGWKADSIKRGDKITVELHPMKDGTPGGQVMRVLFPDGRVLITSQARGGRPGAAGSAAPGLSDGQPAAPAGGQTY